MGHAWCIGPKIYYWEILSFLKTRNSKGEVEITMLGSFRLSGSLYCSKTWYNQPSNMAHAMKGGKLSENYKDNVSWLLITSAYIQRSRISSIRYTMLEAQGHVFVCGRPWDGAERQLVAQGPLKRTQVTRNSWLQEPKHEVTHDHKTSRWTDW